MARAVFRSLLVPLDGSASADAALRLALRLVAPDGEVLVAHSIDRTAIAVACAEPYGASLGPALDAFEADQRAIFATALSTAAAAGVRCATASLDGSPARAVATCARAHGVEAIAMGTHGRRGLARLILGSTAAGVLDAAELPVFVVDEHSAAQVPAAFRSVFVGVDASPASRRAVRFAIDLAAHDGGAVFFANVVQDAMPADEASLSEACSDARAAGVSADSAVLHGDPVEALLIAAQARKADLIAIGAHGRARRPFRLGSVAEAVARTSMVPVLVTPPASTAS
ncbi:MAG TPA: universal stress protein [Candidatus Baltobacteraceae bacterium]|nr:universal stress protein [Candidatus Baltobacteraceae bacterium]